MADDKAPAADAAAADAVAEPEIEEETLCDAPERGSADELLDAGAHDELDAMRHSTAPVMADAVLVLYPGAQFVIGPSSADVFYYALTLDRQLQLAVLAKSEATMAAWR